MQFSAPKNWVNIDQLRGLLFFVQRVEELSFSYTMDSYKSPTTSLSGLVRETMECLVRADEHPNQAKHAAQIVREIAKRTKGNTVLARVLNLPLSDYLSLNSENRSESVVQLENLLAELGDGTYLAAIVERVIELSSETKAKFELDLLAKEFVSTLQHAGVSREYIYRTTRETFLVANRVTSSDILFKFCQDIYPHFHQFTVYCSLSIGFKKLDSELLRGFGIHIDIDVPEEINRHFHGRFISQLKDSRYCLAAISVKSMDYYSAISRATDTVGSVSSLYQVFNHKWDYSVGAIAIAEQHCCAGLLKEARVSGNPMHIIDDHKPAAAQSVLAEFLQSATFVRGIDRNRYLNLVAMHGLSTRSATADSQLINLWTCLETITPSNRSGKDVSNISNVVENIVPILSINYLSRLVTNLLNDLNRWDRKKLSYAFSLHAFAPETSYNDKLLLMISDPSNEVGISYILEELGDFELLRFRLFNLAVLFRDKSKCLDAILSHEENIRWQIHRIYRIRNSIVHSGESPDYVKYLVENAHDYYDQCFEFCMRLSMNMPDFDTFEMCFLFAKKQYINYIKNMDNSDYLKSCLWKLKQNKGKNFLFQGDG